MSKVARVTFSLMIATVIAKILGFGREIVLASVYGTTMYSDVYITCMNIPVVIFASIGSALSTTFIPMFFSIKEKEGEKEALKYTNNVFNIVVILCILLSILGLIFTENLVKIFAIGFEGERLLIAIKFTRIIITSIIFTGLSYIMTSYLQIKNNFTVPGLISIPKNLIIIVSILLSVKYGPYCMIWGTLIGMSVEFIFQLPFAIKNGYRYNLYINIKDKNLKKTILLICPVLIGVAANQINIMFDRTLASTLVEGSISALNYANKLNTFVMGLFILSISAVVYPMLSKLSLNKDRSKFTKIIVNSINSIVLLVMPISVGAIVLANPIVKILFERGEFDHRATEMTAIALSMYSLGMVAYGVSDILTKVLYSLQDMKTPMINGIVTVAINILLNIILLKHMELAGLAFSTSMSLVACVLLLFIELKKKIGYFGQDKIIKTGIKSFFASIIMGIITVIAHKTILNYLSVGMVNEIIALFGSVIVGVISYGILVVLLKIEEIEMLLDMIKSKMVGNKYYPEENSL